MKKAIKPTQQQVNTATSIIAMHNGRPVHTPPGRREQRLYEQAMRTMASALKNGVAP